MENSKAKIKTQIEFYIEDLAAFIKRYLVTVICLSFIPCHLARYTLIRSSRKFNHVSPFPLALLSCIFYPIFALNIPSDFYTSGLLDSLLSGSAYIFNNTQKSVENLIYSSLPILLAVIVLSKLSGKLMKKVSRRISVYITYYISISMIFSAVIVAFLPRQAVINYNVSLLVSVIVMGVFIWSNLIYVCYYIYRKKRSLLYKIYFATLALAIQVFAINFPILLSQEIRGISESGTIKIYPHEHNNYFNISKSKFEVSFNIENSKKHPIVIRIKDDSYFTLYFYEIITDSPAPAMKSMLTEYIDKVNSDCRAEVSVEERKKISSVFFPESNGRVLHYCKDSPSFIKIMVNGKVLSDASLMLPSQQSIEVSISGAAHFFDPEFYSAELIGENLYRQLYYELEIRVEGLPYPMRTGAIYLHKPTNQELEECQKSFTNHQSYSCNSYSYSKKEQKWSN